MASDSVVVVAHWQTTDEALETVLTSIAELRPLSLAEPGCLGYEAFRSLTDETALVLIERYRDDAALEAHAGSPHYQEIVVGRVRPLLTDRRVEVLRPRDPR
ncbi:MAG TPA: antibiotic biosynthesis monooxygenase family protein [Mycobacterium sp.]|jgi:quinol monooxygenase YgiN|nr:antibiotic biosynthesis monooxygenase family protein [Mycobacterium sp.]